MNIGSKQKAKHPKAANGPELSIQSKVEFLIFRTLFVDGNVYAKLTTIFVISCRGSNIRRTTNPPREK